MTTGKTITLTRWTFVGKVMSLPFNMLSRLVITFLPRSERLLISWLQSPSAVIMEPLKIKICHCFHYFPIYLPWSDGTGCHDLVFWMLSFKPTFSLSSFTFIKRLFSSSSLSAIRVVSSAYLRLLIFLLAMLIPACALTYPLSGLINPSDRYRLLLKIFFTFWCPNGYTSVNYECLICTISLLLLLLDIYRTPK